MIDFVVNYIIDILGECFVRIIGIDPGYAIVGFGILDYTKSVFSVVGFGAVTTQAHTPFDIRLKTIFDDVSSVLDRYRPEQMAIEKLFFNTNQKTAIDVAQARGAIILAAAQRSIPVFEYTPLQVKNSVVGYGRAEKKQVMEMTRQILKLREVPRPDDTADALALAVTHGHSTHTNIAKQILSI